MKYVRLHNTELKLSNICLGCGSFDDNSETRSFEILDAFVEAGGNFLDTANVYGKWNADKKNHSEEVIGRYLKSRNAYDKIIVATKGGHFDLDTPDISRVNQPEVEKDIEEGFKARSKNLL